MGWGVNPFCHNRATWTQWCSKIFVHTIFSIDKRISVANHNKQWHQAKHDLQPALCAGKRVPVCPEYQSPIVLRLIPILLWSLDWKPLKSAFKFTSDVCSSPDSVIVLSRCSTVCISRSTSCISRALSVLSCWISLLSWTICKEKKILNLLLKGHPR